MSTVNITPDKKCYNSICSLVVSFASLYFALAYMRTGKVICNSGDYATFEGFASGKIIEVTISEILEKVNRNIKPDLIKITVRDLNQSTPGYQDNITILDKTIQHLIFPHLVMFYESNVSSAKEKFGEKNYTTWPASWRLAWVIRNALSHNNRIYYKDQKTEAVTWNQLTVSPSMQDINIETLLNHTDMILLILDMENDLN